MLSKSITRFAVLHVPEFPKTCSRATEAADHWMACANARGTMLVITQPFGGQSRRFQGALALGVLLGFRRTVARERSSADRRAARELAVLVARCAIAMSPTHTIFSNGLSTDLPDVAKNLLRARSKFFA